MPAVIDIEEALAALVLAKPAVAAIVSDRVFPNRVPAREALPAVIFRRTGGGSMPVLNGESAVRSATFQVESWTATSQADARTLDRAVQSAGNRGSFSQSGWWIQSLRIARDTDQDNPQIPVHADDLGLFCSFCEMIVFYQPA